MKEFWLELNDSIPNHIKKSLLAMASQVCDVILVDARDVEIAGKTGVKIAATSRDCDIRVLDGFDEVEIAKLKSAGKAVAVRVTIKGKEDEETAVKAAQLSSDYIITDCSDWKIIPLENIIAKVRGKSKLLAEVSSVEDAELTLKILELGMDGVVLKTSDTDELLKTAGAIKKQTPKIELSTAKIVRIKPLGTGARVCVDTCDLMKPGEGILIGCQSSSLFLVEAEVHENPYVESRPFRINAGALSLYAMSSLNRTRYLSELKAGEEILIVNRKGGVRLANVGRVKIELRPLLLIEAKCADKRVKAIVQNAETIRLVTLNGSKSVTGLKAGDEVLAYITGEGGRHFGVLVKEETVIER